MSRATSVLRVVLVLALTLGIYPIVLRLYVHFTGAGLPTIWNFLSPIIIFIVAWVLVGIAVWSIKRTARKGYSRSI